jgi:hypothetical protein
VDGGPQHPWDLAHQFVVIDSIEKLFQIEISYPAVALRNILLRLCQGLMRRPPRAVMGERRVPLLLQHERVGQIAAGQPKGGQECRRQRAFIVEELSIACPTLSWLTVKGGSGAGYCGGKGGSPGN